ncbi:MAG: alpha-hydroxy acid oxidase [Pseudomonadota bacterium]
MRRVACVDDLRTLARRRVPRMFFDYVDGAAWTESTHIANGEDLAKIKLKQRVAVDVSRRSARSTLLGEQVRIPLAMPPAGLTGVIWPNGEILAMRACEDFGVPYCLSTVSITSLEDLARAASKPFWFQLYFIRDRDFIERLILRAEAAGIKTLVVTLDLQLVGQRNRDIRNGLSSPPKPTLGNIADLIRRPAWCWAMMRYRNAQFGNLHGHVRDLGDGKSLAQWTDEQFDPTLTWDDVQRLRDRWKGKLVLKGVLAPEDAEHALRVGADAIIVSNHGGRQLDGAPSTIEVLPSVVKVVDGRCAVMVDSGFRSGQDVFKALAFGAQGVLMGRALLYGLGAGGQAGVKKALDMVRHELEVTMGLCGVNSIDDIGPHNIYRTPTDTP